MLTYVIRRLLYSIVVLLAASFLIFTFVSVSSDPLAFLRMQPTAPRSRSRASRSASTSTSRSPFGTCTG